MSRNELSKKEQELFAAAVECTSNDSEKEVLSSVLGSITVDYEKLCKKAGYRIAAQAEHAWRQVRGKLLGTLDEKTNVGLLGSISTRTRTRPKVGEASDNLTTVRETGEEAEEDGEEDEEEEDGLGLGGGKETADLPASRKRKHVSFGDDHEYGPAKRNHQRSSPGHQATEATEIGARRREPLPWTQEVMDKYLPPTGVLPPTPFAPPKRAPSARPRLGAAMFRFGYDSEDEGPRRHYPRLSGYQATTEIPFYQGRLPSLEPGSPARGQVAMRTGDDPLLAFAGPRPKSPKSPKSPPPSD